MKIVAVIPARMNSSRFPGKPLAPICGRPMIEHVYRRTAACRSLDAVYIATCDEEIARATRKFGGEAIMTSSAHERASDRTAEAAERLQADIIVMIQGDEPLITPEMIEAAVSPMLENPSLECVNLICRIDNAKDFNNRNTIKVVINQNAEAIYFSRAPIPAVDFAPDDFVPFFKQVCVIPFRRDFLSRFAQLPPTALERAESIDMLRIIEHGGKIKLVETKIETHAVDTPEDLQIVEKLMKRESTIFDCSNPISDGVPRK